MKLGRVYGPYQAKDRAPYVVIQLFNKDGTELAKRMISYNSYLKQKAQGLHDYKEPNPEDLKVSVVKTKLNKTDIEHKHICSNCNKGFYIKYKPVIGKRIFCSEKCRCSYRRKQAKKEPLTFDNQFVVTINRGKPDQHYIVVENIPGKRIARFIAANKCILEISGNKDNKTIYRLKYDLKDTVLIKPVKGYKKFFWITEDAQLVSKRTKKILSQTLMQTGYYAHVTRIGGRNGINKLFRIHRLVSEAFIANPENKPQVNHIDGIKTNNHKSNLEWCTNQENVIHAYRTGLARGRPGVENSGAKFTEEQVREIRALYSSKTMGPRALGRKYNVSHVTILEVVNNRTYQNVI